MTGRRSETARHTNSVDATQLIEGDRISPKLVASHRGQLGQPIDRTPQNLDDDPDTQLLRVTQINRGNDVNRAILMDVDEVVWVVATSHKPGSAWTQRERDWKVRQVGDTINVTDGEATLLKNDGPVEDETQWVSRWVEIVLNEPEVSDRRWLTSSSTIRLVDVEGRRGVGTFQLGWGDD